MQIQTQPQPRQKTKKIRNAISKKALWSIFESEIHGTSSKDRLECMYSSTSGNREFCEGCESILAFAEEGFLTCTNPKCGIVYKDMIDQSAEWRYYGNEDSHGGNDPTRCGMPINPFLEESSYGCRVLYGGSMSYEMQKIRRYTEWQSMPYREKTQFDDFQIISTKAQMAGMSKKFIDDAIMYHKKVSEHESKFRGDNKDSILAASIYIACRSNGFPRTAKEIAQMFSIDVTNATKGCKIAMTIINDLEKDMDIEEKTNLGKTKPEAFVERFCSKLNISNELTKLCQFIAIKVEKDNLMPENTPHSIAAGVVFFVTQLCQLNINKREVKSVSEISEVTISKCFKKLEKLKELLVPSMFLKKYLITA
jgi:transcription initiation factor TFIIB